MRQPAIYEATLKNGVGYTEVATEDSMTLSFSLDEEPSAQTMRRMAAALDTARKRYIKGARTLEAMAKTASKIAKKNPPMK